MQSQVVRSIVMPNGIVTAHADRTLLFKPLRGREQKIRMAAQATVMLACYGPQKFVFRLLVGDAKGSVHLVSLPELNLIESHELGKTPVTALALHEPGGRKRVIAGLQDGGIYALGEGVPSGSLKLFSLDGSVGLIHSTDEILTVYSGWTREVRHWNGDAVSPAKRWFQPPTTPTKRVSQQLILPKAVRA